MYEAIFKQIIDIKLAKLLHKDVHHNHMHVLMLYTYTNTHIILGNIFKTPASCNCKRKAEKPNQATMKFKSKPIPPK